MKIKLLVPVLMSTLLSLVYAEIHTGETTLRLGEIIDFDAGQTAIDTASQAKDCNLRNDRSDEKLLCRSGNSLQYDLGFFFSGGVVDDLEPRPEKNCSEGIKSLFSTSTIFEFKKKDFFLYLDNPPDTSDTASFVNYQIISDSVRIGDGSGNTGTCTIFEGPSISICAGDTFFCTYYYLVTDKGHRCVFTILERDTVDEQCGFDRYDAIKIRYYLQTDPQADLSSISEEIRERLAVNTGKHRVPLLYNGKNAKKSTVSTYDILGRIQNRPFTTPAIKIITTESRNTRLLVEIK